MAYYIVNSNEYDGHHEVHNTSTHCDNPTYPDPENRIDLDWHNNCSDAVSDAEAKYPAWDVDGCAYCTDCHTK